MELLAPSKAAPSQAAQGADAMDHGLALRCLQPLDATGILVLHSQVAPSLATASSLAWALLLALGAALALPTGAGLALPLALRCLGLLQGPLQPPLATLATSA